MAPGIAQETRLPSNDILGLKVKSLRSRAITLRNGANNQIANQPDQSLCTKI